MAGSTSQSILMLSENGLSDYSGELASQTVDIALQVGFSSQNHLTQQFKCLTGMTSKQVR